MANDFFNDLSETLSKTAKGLSERMGSMYDAQKIRSKIAGEEKLINKALADIGQIVFDRFAEGGEVEEDIRALCEEICQHNESIESLKEEAAGKKGQKICPGCKKSVDKEVSFCPFCGTPVPDPEPPVEEEPEEAEEFFEDEQTAEEVAEEAVREAVEEGKAAAEEFADAVADAVAGTEENE
ncbi:MAG: zinc ribbon domain-containing protein [Blautia sp.]|nr:zinc ribbon domain-containing protein [Blautia sp.]